MNRPHALAGHARRTRPLLHGALLLALLAGVTAATAGQAQARPPSVGIHAPGGTTLGHIEPTREPDTWTAWVSMVGTGARQIRIACDRTTERCATEDGRAARCEGRRGCLLVDDPDDLLPQAPYATNTPRSDVAWHVITPRARLVAYARPPRDFFAPAVGFPGGAVVLLHATYVACDANVVDRSGRPCPDPRLRPPTAIPGGEPFTGPQTPRLDRREPFSWQPVGRIAPRRVLRDGRGRTVRCRTGRCALVPARDRASRPGVPARVTRANGAWIVRDADGWRLGRVVGLDASRRSGEVALLAALARL